MQDGSHFAAQICALRRFARALTGNQLLGDGYVAAAMERWMLKSPVGFEPGRSVERPELFRTILNLHIDSPDKKLGKLMPLARAAYLLVALEAFSRDEAARILSIDASRLTNVLSEAGVKTQSPVDVVIIEDEPAVAFDLESAASGLGHRVVGICRTRAEAIDAVCRRRPGVVLTDVRLADGGSGLDAMSSILRTYSVPAVFITGCPEKLLTGLKPEPAFIVGKPFSAEQAKAMIDQALYTDARARALTAWREGGVRFASLAV